MRKMFLVIVDSYSKLVLLEMCSQFHIQPLKQLLTVQGLVLQLMDYHKFMPHIMDHISQVKNLNVFWKGMAFCISILRCSLIHLLQYIVHHKILATQVQKNNWGNKYTTFQNQLTTIYKNTNLRKLTPGVAKEAAIQILLWDDLNEKEDL